MKLVIYSILMLFTVLCGAQTPDDKALQKKYHEALEKYNSEVDSASATFYYERGNIRFDHFDNKTAIADYNKAIEMDPGNYKFYHNRGLAKMELGMTTDAIADFDKTIELMPISVYAYTKRSTCRFILEDYAGAKRDCSIAIGLDANNAVAYYNRGISNYMLGSKDNGCYDLNKAYELGEEKSSEAIKKYCKK